MPTLITMLKPSALVTTKAKPVTSFEEIKDEAYNMLDLLDHGIIHNGYRMGAVALSHCQVSEEPFNFFVVAREYKHFFDGRRIILNAKIVDQKNIVPFEEGCLSFPDREHYKTKRFRNIEVEWQFPAGTGEIHWRVKREQYDGLAAMIIQHEVDHANGENIYSKFLEDNRITKK